MIGSEKFGGNSWPSGGRRENVGGGTCMSSAIIGFDVVKLSRSIPPVKKIF